MNRSQPKTSARGADRKAQEYLNTSTFWQGEAFHEPVRSAVVPTAGSDSVPLSEATSPAGRRGEPAGADACATPMRFKVRGQFQEEHETIDEPVPAHRNVAATAREDRPSQGFVPTGARPTKGRKMCPCQCLNLPDQQSVLA